MFLAIAAGIGLLGFFGACQDCLGMMIMMMMMMMNQTIKHENALDRTQSWSWSQDTAVIIRSTSRFWTISFARPSTVTPQAREVTPLKTQHGCQTKKWVLCKKKMYFPFQTRPTFYIPHTRFRGGFDFLNVFPPFRFGSVPLDGFFNTLGGGVCGVCHRWRRHWR